MGSNTSVLLGEHFEKFIKKQVKSGRYSSASEVIRVALRLFEEEEKRKNLLLRSAIEAGEQSGLSTPFDNEAFKQEMKSKYSGKK